MPATPARRSAPPSPAPSPRRRGPAGAVAAALAGPLLAVVALVGVGLRDGHDLPGLGALLATPGLAGNDRPFGSPHGARRGFSAASTRRAPGPLPVGLVAGPLPLADPLAVVPPLRGPAGAGVTTTPARPRPVRRPAPVGAGVTTVAIPQVRSASAPARRPVGQGTSVVPGPVVARAPADAPAPAGRPHEPTGEAHAGGPHSGSGTTVIGPAG